MRTREEILADLGTGAREGVATATEYQQLEVLLDIRDHLVEIGKVLGEINRDMAKEQR